MKITRKEFNDFKIRQSYFDTGDNLEKTFHLIMYEFGNHEVFWKNFVTPSTERILQSNSIRSRKEIPERLKEIFSLHYTIFININYAREAILKRQISYFENAYAHLGSACDCAEEFIEQTYLLSNELLEEESKTLKRLTIIRFLMISLKWYLKNYKNFHANYLSKGKNAQIKLLGRNNLLTEFLGKRS